MTFCGSCKQKIKRNEYSILCNDSCVKWYHHSCAELSVEDIKFYGNKRCTEKWICKSCKTSSVAAQSSKRRSVGIPSTPSVSPSANFSDYNDPEPSIRDVLVKLIQMENKYDEVLKKLEEQYQINHLLRQELVQIKNDIKEKESNATEQIIHEVNQRQLNESNVILYNVPESKQEDQKSRSDEDLSTVVSLLSDIQNIDTNKLKTVRIGRYVRNKIRPIRVRMLNKTEAITVLKSKKNIIDKNTGLNINVSSDQTISQRNYLKKLKEDLKKDENKNKTIKYVRGVPTIVDTIAHSANQRF